MAPNAPPEPCTHKLSSFHELMDCKCCFQDVKCCVTMQSDPILIWIWSWDCRVRRAETSLCPVFILINGEKKRLWTAGERDRGPDQSLDGSHLPLYFCCLVCLFVFINSLLTAGVCSEKTNVSHAHLLSPLPLT